MEGIGDVDGLSGGGRGWFVRGVGEADGLAVGVELGDREALGGWEIDGEGEEDGEGDVDEEADGEGEGKEVGDGRADGSGEGDCGKNRFNNENSGTGEVSGGGVGGDDAEEGFDVEEGRNTEVPGEKARVGGGVRVMVGARGCNEVGEGVVGIAKSKIRKGMENMNFITGFEYGNRRWERKKENVGRVVSSFFLFYIIPKGRMDKRDQRWFVLSYVTKG